ncbi:2-dehydropantoate 2-reductase [Paraburkholderia kururiensis]|uniref:2-dehydropantoate 2-reductase n=1 Tax=Paraburkholderia kururiensis TaxID=984307 RepID=UPI0018F52BC1|nr:2-dehydropantoate 2-reductase [Paraburkholderia kururiensis]
MRILVVGAGGVGGYFGARMAHAGRDVTFLVRPQRAEELRRAGLVVRSRYGDLTLRDVKTVVKGDLREPFDLILLSCKAYDLADAIDSFQAAVGPSTVILPLLNGMQHVDELQRRFGTSKVMGGLCLIAATLNAEREIVHLNDMQAIVFGELAGGVSERAQVVAEAMGNAGFDVTASANIVQELWEKWVFLATLAGITCLFRASVGEILATPDGERAIANLFAECSAVAAHNGYAVRPEFNARMRAILFAAGSPLTASMLRDLQAGSRIEADHVLGDLIRRGDDRQRDDAALSVLRLAYSHLKAYEVRRAAQPQAGAAS